ncbi:MAG TPA: aminotransferase class III-fold pyridoxal phosphate-dependent enzyme [Streptosporangiaceae bacterium]|nr:aminotransferase class III-fold pyridoxal phosphate-dependent enzyme [Streptosporangiaceae bacterium]
MPAELAATLIVLTWNDAESFAAVMAEHGDQVAAVITEPAVFNTGCILPEPGYLELLRELTARHGALLIFDEVITGFRFARGGAQEYFGVTPDLTTMAKGLGGGFPVAAIGGSREVMSIIADGRYSHSGTYNANVAACAAVSATMDLLAEPGLFERQRALGERLMAELRSLAGAAGLPVIVEGLGCSRSGSATARSGTGATPSATPGGICSPDGGRRCCCAACSFTRASTRTCLYRWCTPTPTWTRC